MKQICRSYGTPFQTETASYKHFAPHGAKMNTFNNLIWKDVYIGYNDLLYNGLEPLTGTRQSGLFRQSRGIFANFHII